MTRKKANYYLYRIYKLLQDPDAICKLRKFRKNLAGYAVPEAKYMAIDPRSDAACTLIHESLHILYSNLPDHPGSIFDADRGQCSKWIQKTEMGIANALTLKQWRNLYFRFANKLF